MRTRSQATYYDYAAFALLIVHVVILLGTAVFVPARLLEAVDPVQRVYSLMAADVGILCFAYVFVASAAAALLDRGRNVRISGGFCIVACLAAIGAGGTLAMHLLIEGRI